MIDEVMAEVMIQATSNLFLEIVHAVDMTMMTLFCGNGCAAEII